MNAVEVYFIVLTNFYPIWINACITCILSIIHYAVVS
jgi:hypothetical protein